MSYAQFAQTYDQLMDKSLYVKWANLVKRYAPTHATILDMACGSGDLACLLENDYKMIGCDVSENMLAIASEKTSKTMLLQGDMCDFSMQEQVDVVTCFADSLCYLDDETAVQDAFSCAYALLKDGGYYLFDVHSIYQMENVYPDYSFQYVDLDTVFTWQSFVGEFPYSVEHELTCLNQLDNGLYSRYDETHYERTYPIEQYSTWLKEAGFQTVEITSHFGEDEIVETTPRWFFIAKK